jgi:tungstate transport system permease protein
MDYIWDGIVKAVQIIFSGDAEFYEVVGLSLYVSSVATAIAAAIVLPFSVFMGLWRFKGEKTFAKITGTLMSVPSILIGLLVMITLSRRGPLGPLKLSYTPTAMIIAQALLVTPLICGLAYQAVTTKGRLVEQVGNTLGGAKWSNILLVIKELKAELIIIAVTAFGRAISEVGAVMVAGGNIKGKTRVITTTIALNNSMGRYEMAIALGIILLTVSLGVNWLIYLYKEKSVGE